MVKKIGSQLSMQSISPTVIDLFCGAGGMSWELEKAGFNVLAGLDNDAQALKTFARNHYAAKAQLVDLSTLDPNHWLKSMGLKQGQVDCIVGGPPCQGFSKNVPRANRFLEDSRNLLIRKFLEFVRSAAPRIVIMENVAELVNAFDGAFTTEILEALKQMGYDADVQIINAAELGVPQYRRRAFFFASRHKVCFPKQTHWPVDATPPLFADIYYPQITVWDAISDLPSLRHGEGKSPVSYQIPPLTPYQELMRQNTTLLYNHVARPLKPTQFERLNSLAPGEGAKHLPEHLKPKGYYSGAYGRLTKDMVSRTLTRWMFHPGSGRYGHPVDIRTITIREAARLQSFSDDFIFEGSFTQSSSQIGNSVPPLIMKAFIPILLEQLSS